MTTVNPSPLAELSAAEKAAAFSVFRDRGVNPAQLFADLLRFVAITKKVPFAIGKGESVTDALAILDELEEWAEREKIIQKIEAETGRKVNRIASVEQWLDDAVQHAVHPDLEAMTDEELLTMADAEVKQHRAEKRALEAIQASRH